MQWSIVLETKKVLRGLLGHSYFWNDLNSYALLQLKVSVYEKALQRIWVHIHFYNFKCPNQTRGTWLKIKTSQMNITLAIHQYLKILESKANDVESKENWFKILMLVA